MTLEEFGAELATWPPPIDVIRHELGLPERWQLRASRALNRLLDHPSSQVALFIGIDSMWKDTIRALNGLSPAPPPLYSWAPRPMRIR